MYPFDKSGLSKADILELIQNANGMLGAAKKVANKLSRCAALIGAEVQAEEYVLSSYEESTYGDVPPTRMQSVCRELQSCLQDNAVALYSASNVAIDFDKKDDDSDEENTENHDQESSGFDVRVHLAEDAIYVKMPMLPSTNNEKAFSKFKSKTRVLFRKEISDFILNDPNFYTYSYKNLTNKLVHFLYVFSSQSQRLGLLIDNGNHEIKYIIDAVTGPLPGGDSPLCCSIFSSATLSDLVPEGTYVTVTSAENGPKNDREILEFWAKRVA